LAAGLGKDRGRPLTKGIPAILLHRLVRHGGEHTGENETFVLMAWRRPNGNWQEIGDAGCSNGCARRESWGGLFFALGGLGVVLTSAFYVASPPATVLPMPEPIMSDVLSGAVRGGRWIRAAGTVGVIADVSLIAGGLRKRRMGPCRHQHARLRSRRLPFQPRHPSH
jgi:hypothetical protein